MENLFATRSVSITELKRSPSAVLEQANFEPVAVLNHNKPAAYLLAPDIYQALIERFEDDDLIQLIQARQAEPSVKVHIDDL